MNKKMLLGLGLVLLLVGLLLAVGIWKFRSTEFAADQIVALRFDHDGETEIILPESEAEIIRTALRSHMLYNDRPSCGFTERRSIKIGDEMICPACDGHGIFQYEDMYFSVSDEQLQAIHAILGRYGYTFPCV